MSRRDRWASHPVRTALGVGCHGMASTPRCARCACVGRGLAPALQAADRGGRAQGERHGLLMHGHRGGVRPAQASWPLVSVCSMRLGRDKTRYLWGTFSHPPGSRARLLSLSPLRTARESFPSSSSSLLNAPCGTRWCHVSRLAMDLVPRCTASALPLNEWVRRCCKARTLPHRPACTAFTRRAWSLRTIRWTAYQSMVCQATGPAESAPVRVATAVICRISLSF
jgi:hypothetical protein